MAVRSDREDAATHRKPEHGGDGLTGADTSGRVYADVTANRDCLQERPARRARLPSTMRRTIGGTDPRSRDPPGRPAIVHPVRLPRYSFCSPLTLRSANTPGFAPRPRTPR